MSTLQPRRTSLEQVVADVEDFADFADHIASEGRAAFLADDMRGRELRTMAQMTVINLSSAVDRLPDDVKDRVDQPWEAIRGMRNITAHTYEIIKPERLFNVMAGRVREVADALRDHLESC